MSGYSRGGSNSLSTNSKSQGGGPRKITIKRTVSNKDIEMDRAYTTDKNPKLSNCAWILICRL